MITVGSICTGYGGLELALDGVELAWCSEIDPHASLVIAERFPGVPNLGDINNANPTPVDLITAGFPCQDISVAGHQAGLNGHRSRLWWRICDVIGHLRPRFVLLENVAAILTTGGPEVIGSLTAMGYDTRWGIVRASDVGAPHQRARWFCIADTDGSRLERSQRASRQWENRRPAERATTDSDGGRLQSQRRSRLPSDSDTQHRDNPHRRDSETFGRSAQRAATDTDGPSRPQPVADTRRSATPITPPNHRFTFGRYADAVHRWEQLTRTAPTPTTNGLPKGRLNPRFVEWMMGLPAGWVTDLDMSRTQQLKMLGNGVVPQQAALAIRLLTEG